MLCERVWQTWPERFTSRGRPVCMQTMQTPTLIALALYFIL